LAFSAEIVRKHAGDYAESLSVAADLVHEAGQIALGYHQQELSVDLKEGNEPVTIADRECSAHIVQGLNRAFPDDVVISEEVADDSRRLDAERVWYVDPIDGTKAFIRGEQGFCVMIGLTIAHQPVLGAVCQPKYERLVFAAQGSGSWALHGERCTRLGSSSVSRVGEARFLGTKSNPRADWALIEEHLGLDFGQRISSFGLKLCTIAMGASDLHANPNTNCSSWDTCAPQVILQEAGGSLSDLRGLPLRYDQKNTTRHGRGLIASNGPLHQPVVDKFAALFGKGGPR
jgi:3'(2'), 5'-bisphosphate nucleotidase